MTDGEKGRRGQKVNGSRAAAVSHYQAWAKLRSGARFNLAVSGIPDYPLSDLPVRLDDIEIGGRGPPGFHALVERRGAQAGVPHECVVSPLGAGVAKFLALTLLAQTRRRVFGGVAPLRP